jgi:flagellin
MTVINTNVASLINQAALNRNTKGLQDTMEKLSTGRRINSASDDAAGLGITNRMTAQIQGLKQALRNSNDGISLIQTAEGSTNEITAMLQRMRELAVQSLNDTYSDSDRASMNAEYQQLVLEIQRIAKTTKWSDYAILHDDDLLEGKTFTFKVGADSSDESTIDITFSNFNPDDDGSITNDIFETTIADSESANSTLAKIDTVINNINEERATMGAKINRIQFAVNNLTNIITHLSESRSRIEDVDYSEATSELARRQIIQQAATAMLAQANQSPQTVLQLLKNG